MVLSFGKIRKNSFVLADFMYGISLLIIAISLGIFIGKMVTNLKENLEKANIIEKIKEYGVIQILYPENNFIVNKEVFNIKLFSMKDLPIKYKVFFFDYNDNVNFCSQDIIKLKKGLNTIPLNLRNCINTKNGIIKFSILYEDTLVFDYNIKYSNRSANIIFKNLPLRNSIRIGSEIFEGLPYLYYSVDPTIINYELYSPYYYVEGSKKLNVGENFVIDPSSFVYINVSFNLNTYSNKVYSVYLNNYFVGSLTSTNPLVINYKNDYKIKNLKIYENDKLMLLVKDLLSVNSNSYTIEGKTFEVCLKYYNGSDYLPIPGMAFDTLNKEIYYTDHGTKNSCLTVDLLFSPDISSRLLNFYSLDYKLSGDKTFTTLTDNTNKIEVILS